MLDSGLLYPATLVARPVSRALRKLHHSHLQLIKDLLDCEKMSLYIANDSNAALHSRLTMAILAIHVNIICVNGDDVGSFEIGTLPRVRVAQAGLNILS